MVFHRECPHQFEANSHCLNIKDDRQLSQKVTIESEILLLYIMRDITKRGQLMTLLSFLILTPITLSQLNVTASLTKSPLHHIKIQTK